MLEPQKAAYRQLYLCDTCVMGARGGGMAAGSGYPQKLLMYLFKHTKCEKRKMLEGGGGSGRERGVWG